MARSRVIPNYDLYGDASRLDWSSALNFEWIPQRSSIYHWQIQPHRHDSFIQVLYLVEGHAEVQLDGALQMLDAPALMVIPAGHVHAFRFSSDINGPVVTALQKALESAAAATMPALLDTLRTPRLMSLQSEMRYIDQLMPLFRALENESHTNAEGQMAAGISLMTALLVQVHRISHVAQSLDSHTHYGMSRKAKQIEKFRSLIDKKFRIEHSLQYYANEVGVSVGQLSRLCRELLGKSSLDVMNDRLLQEAQRELVYTSLPIKQLAAELGYEDDAYFSRFFRKHTGLTPKAYRAQSLKKLHAIP